MKKTITMAIIFMCSSVMSQEGAHCGFSNENVIYASNWEEKELCIDPFATICRKSDDHKKRVQRADKTKEYIQQKAMDTVFDRYKASLARIGISQITPENYQSVTKSAIPECLKDANCDEMYHIPEGLIDEEKDGMFQYLVHQQFKREISQYIDSKSDLLDESYNLIKEKLIEQVQEELKDKLSASEMSEQIQMLRDTVGVFSGSIKSLEKKFPNIRPNEREQIKRDFNKDCIKKLNLVHNQFYREYMFEDKDYYVVMTCPAEVMSSLEGAETMRSIVHNLAFGLSHELGHQISLNLVKSDTYNKHNRCLSGLIPRDEMRDFPSTYKLEAEADYWAKRVTSKMLAEMKDSSTEDKIIFIKETFTALCPGVDDGIHHSSEVRANRILKMNPEFYQAFNCADNLPEVLKAQSHEYCTLEGNEKINLNPTGTKK